MILAKFDDEQRVANGISLAMPAACVYVGCITSLYANIIPCLCDFRNAKPFAYPENRLVLAKVMQLTEALLLMET